MFFFPITCFRGSNKCELLIIPVTWLCYGLSPDSVFKPKCWLFLSFVHLLFSIHYSAFTPLKSSSPSILRYIFNKCILTIIYVSNWNRNIWAYKIFWEMFINPRTITNNFLLKKANKASSIHTTYSCATKKKLYQPWTLSFILKAQGECG